VKLEFESYPGAFVEIDFEVPAVVVIDPGHGGDRDEAGSKANNATSPSGVKEKTMALDFGLSLRDTLRAKAREDKLSLKVLMTRDTDINPSGAERAHVARDNGADILFVIHFNSDDVGDPAHGRPPHRARGTLEVMRTTNNVVPQQDTDLSNRVIDRIVGALHQFGDAGANHRAQVTYADMPAVASDLNIGNTQAYHPIRVGYCEVEFIDYGANTADRADDVVDILLNTGPNAAAARTAIVHAMSDGIIDDLKRQPVSP
jgi:N-acetylmuramoyl-L-alanine amidase